MNRRLRSPRPHWLGRLRLAGLLILVGLLVEAVSLLWRHHLAFVLFLGLGGLLIGLGVLVYLAFLLALARRGPDPSESMGPSGATGSGG